ncbi:MAG: cytochrome c3 family protein [candidate division WOR-3 bacterium]
MILIFFLILFENSDCLVCHEDIKMPGRAHEKVKCSDCHTGIKELPHEVPLSNVNCGLCHKEEMGVFEMDPHERARKKGNLKAPGCTDCHGTHDIEPVIEVKSKLHPLNLDKFCATCHPSVSVPEKYHAVLYPSEKCLECHDKEIKEKLRKSVHKNHECVDCHRTVYSLEPDGKHVKKLNCKDCGLCHRKECEEHEISIHGMGIKEKKPAAKCWDCHDSHEILEAFNKNSKVYYVNLPETCGKCHSKPEFAEKWGITIKNPYALYEESIHHEMLLKGERAATCSDCHGVHNIVPHRDILSTIYKQNVPKTCSKCHEKEYMEYVKSDHFRAIRFGNFDAPSCIDCHSEHRILPPWDPKSPVYPLNIPKTCADCHESVKLSERYGIPVMELKSYLASYHGVKLGAGNIKVANCASCHGNHSILPSSDPESPVNKKNLPITCGKCHKGIAEKTGFIGPIHERIDRNIQIIKKIVSLIYILLIIVTITSMIIYCFFDYWKKRKEFFIKGFREFKLEKVENTKFSYFERRLHLIHIISFFILVYTGFAHHYPENFFFSFFVKIGNGALRAYLHRIAGTLTIISFIITVLLMLFTKKGREKFSKILFNLKDISDAINLLLYNLNIKKEKPELDHPFTFYEKFEFWALVWGTIVMSITGIALWFKDFFLNFMPSFILDIFLLIHFYEAILATLAILTWHFYWAIFDPEVYPMNPLMFEDRVFSYYLKK